ncbi:MAG: response regulator [Kofleriaceae bacterium]|nr:response regulator [Kofleriaceae bacterium]
MTTFEGLMSRPLRVLFIEDTEDDMLLVLRELRRGGFAPDWLRVQDAAELSTALAEAWELVLCDFTLPGFGPMAALEQVRERRGDVPFIVVSGTIGEEAAVELLRAGAHDFVLKDRLARLVPAVDRELREALNRVELRRAEDALARVEKLRALGQMATGIAHDLKNVLNPLGLHLELVDRALRRAGVDSHASVATMREIMQHGVATIDRLRAFCRQEPDGPAEPVDLLTTARAALELVRPRTDGGVRVELRDHAYDVGTVPGRRADVIDAVVNLAINAIEAVSDAGGGAVTIRTGSDDDAAWIEVTDDGPGMPPDVEARVFEPFFSTKGTQGTGLGLANVFATMQRHHGDVVLDTGLGRGTRFQLRFPRAAAAGPAVSG